MYEKVNFCDFFQFFDVYQSVNHSTLKVCNNVYMAVNTVTTLFCSLNYNSTDFNHTLIPPICLSYSQTQTTDSLELAVYILSTKMFENFPLSPGTSAICCSHRRAQISVPLTLSPYWTLYGTSQQRSLGILPPSLQLPSYNHVPLSHPLLFHIFCSCTTFASIFGFLVIAFCAVFVFSLVA